MTHDLTYRLMHPSEAKVVADLCMRVGQEYLFSDYPAVGQQSFANYIDPVALRRRLQTGHFALVATATTTPSKAPAAIVGAIEIRQNCHISLLFVEGAYHRRGIGKTLLKEAIALSLQRQPQLAFLTVNASTYALPIYKQLGFYPTGPQRTQDGICSTPMAWPRSQWPVGIVQNLSM
jgi:ribosomal protein S18 acetylase RimI-like enzyme